MAVITGKVNWLTTSLIILREILIPVVICYPFGIFIQVKEINKCKYIPYLASYHGVMKLKKDRLWFTAVSIFLIGQTFILKYYQVMLKLPFKPT